VCKQLYAKYSRLFPLFYTYKLIYAYTYYTLPFLPWSGSIATAEIIIMLFVDFSPLVAGYLRGVEVIDHTSFTYNGRAQSFEWVNHGFKLHLPEDALPPEVDECRIHVKVSLSGQYQFPEDTELISGIYWITTRHKFAKAVTIEIQHCSNTEHPSSLTYIVAKCTEDVLPYQFSILSGGTFSPSSRYGSIDVTHFSGVAIASRSPRRPSFAQRLAIRRRQELSNVKSYCARLYYSKSGVHGWEVYFAIMWDLEIHVAVSPHHI